MVSTAIFSELWVVVFCLVKGKFYTPKWCNSRVQHAVPTDAITTLCSDEHY